MNPGMVVLHPLPSALSASDPEAKLIQHAGFEIKPFKLSILKLA
jgi:hypothetical protein